MTLGQRLTAEGIGTALLLATIIGSGIMGERLAGGNTAITLLANAIATGAALVALILTFGPISGAHFNPLVSIGEAVWSRLKWREVPLYAVAQVIGAFAGVAAAHLMFSEAVFSASQNVRAGLPLIWSEVVATFGLLCVIAGTVSARPSAVALAVGGYITAAYWFTASTSFANPAVTLARAASDTFAGINPNDVPGFLAGQVFGASLAIVLMRWLVPTTKGGMKGMDMNGMDNSKKEQGTVHKGVGVVTKVNTANGSVTLAHEPIKSMSWSAMTMGFTVKDKSLLDNLQAEKKVEFEFVQQGKDYVITGVK